MRTPCLVIVACVALFHPARAGEDLTEAIRAAEIATLLRQVAGQDDRDRDNAAIELMDSGEAGLEAFAKALSHPDPGFRRHALRALNGEPRRRRFAPPDWRPPASGLATALLAAAKEASSNRSDVLRALCRHGWGDPTLAPFWIEVAQSGDVAERAVALSWMASLPPTGEESAAVTSGLVSNPVETLELVAAPTWWSFWAEGNYAEPAARAQAVALETIGRSDVRAKVTAARALGRAQSGDAKTIRALTRATRDSDWEVSEAAWVALADLVEAEAAPPETLATGFENAPESVLPRFVDAVYGREPRVVAGLRNAFARSAGPAKLVLALALVRAGVRADRPVIACIASWEPAGACDDALRSIPGALEVVRAATAWRAGETSDFTRASAICALGAFPPEEVTADLVTLLRCDDTFVLRPTVQTLHRLGIAREETIAALTRMLHARSAVGRIVAAGLLLDIGVRCPDQARSLVQCLTEPDDACYAADLLGRLGADAAPVAPALCRALSSKDFGVRSGAATALAEIRLSGEESYQALLRAARENTKLDTRPQAVRELCNAVWKALLAHPLLSVDDVAELLRETAVHANEWYPDDLADVLVRQPREETLRVLLEMLAEPPRRLFAVRLLARIAPERAEMANALVALIREGQPEERQEALRIAEQAGLHRDLVVAMRLPDLFPPFGRPPDSGGCALEPPLDPGIVALCARVLLRRTGGLSALDALRTLDPPAKEAVPQLRELARRADPALRSQIERTVQALGG